jgi:hypothetical protein
MSIEASKKELEEACKPMLGAFAFVAVCMSKNIKEKRERLKRIDTISETVYEGYFCDTATHEELALFIGCMLERLRWCREVSDKKRALDKNGK